MFRTAALATALCVALAGCSAGTAVDDGRLQVVAAFYPLAYAAEQVGGDRVTVTSLTKPGAEPHDLELLPKQVLQVQEADLAIHLAGFQPVVDAAVAEHAAGHALDVTTAARLLSLEDEHASGAEVTAPEGHTDEAHAGESHGEESHGEESHGDESHAAEGGATDHSGHDHGTFDPHFWLDPTRYADVARAIADAMAQRDPDGAPAYRAKAEEFARRLQTLDAELHTGLATCRNRQVVTGHQAFGYLATRYDLREESVSGLSPDQEPTATSMAHVVDFVRAQGISTIYAEALASPALTETLARETGARVAILDPVEGITDDSAGRDYFEVMRSNLSTLRSGQDCS